MLLMKRSSALALPKRCPMAEQQQTLAKLADLVDRIESIHAKLYRLELAVEAELRRN